MTVLYVEKDRFVERDIAPDTMILFRNDGLEDVIEFMGTDLVLYKIPCDMVRSITRN